jgi:lysophospholipase L1-like esterase
MREPFLRNKRQIGLLAVLLLTSAALLMATPVKRKHHLTASGARSQTAIHPSKAKSGHSRSRSRLSYPRQRIDPVQRAALVEEIGAKLRKPAAQAISYPGALEDFYAQLAAREREISSGSAPVGTVRVLQWGDSHTAADMFTGETRRLIQERFGDGGIGYSYAGHPFAGYRIFGSRRSQSSGWATQGNKFRQLGDGELGMGGLSISTERPGEWVTLDAPCATLAVQYLAQPGGGKLEFADNDALPLEIETADEKLGPGTFRYACPPGDHHFVLTTEDRAPVTLLGMVATQPGATWESIGINGAEAPLLLKWDQKLFAPYIEDNAPSLVVLAYGTNEAANHDWDEDSYRQTFATIIDMIHSDVPNSSILVIGPADRSTMQRRKWRAYDGTDKIATAQKAVCAIHGCAYWDQGKRMGGFGSMQQWVSAGWAQADHTHFTGDGYRALADALMTDLMTGYEAYKQGNLHETERTLKEATSGSASANP